MGTTSRCAKPFADDDLLAVWAVSEKDVWAGGYGGLFRFDGSAWTKSALVEGVVRDIAGLAANDVYLIVDGALLRYDGTQIRTVRKDVGGSELFVRAKDDIYVFGRNNVNHFDGRTWRTLAIVGGRIEQDVVGFHVTDDGTLHAVGHKRWLTHAPWP